MLVAEKYNYDRFHLRIIHCPTTPLFRFYRRAAKRQTLEGWRRKYKLHRPKLRQIQILLNSDEYPGRRTAAAMIAAMSTATAAVLRTFTGIPPEGGSFNY